jgi:acyl carrier protein
MTEQEILSEIGEILWRITGVEPAEVTPDKSLVRDLDVDSLSLVEIATAVLDTFDVEIPDERLNDLNTVQDVVNFLAGSIEESSLAWSQAA